MKLRDRKALERRVADLKTGDIVEARTPGGRKIKGVVRAVSQDAVSIIPTDETPATLIWRNSITKVE